MKRSPMARDFEEQHSERKDKRKRCRSKKLRVGEAVEARSHGDGFQGSWHSGIITACSKLARRVKYDYLLNNDASTNLCEWVSVPSVVDGSRSNGAARSLVRPLPPAHHFKKVGFHYGNCVDALYQDAWWEGVVFDHNDESENRKIFFPELGDEMTVTTDFLRVSLDWDEENDEWKQRGNWIFLEVIEQYAKRWPVFVSIKQMWYDVRTKKAFEKIGEWTCPVKSVWRELVLESIKDNFNLTLQEFFHPLNFSDDTKYAVQCKLMSSNLAVETLTSSHTVIRGNNVRSGKTGVMEGCIGKQELIHSSLDNVSLNDMQCIDRKSCSIHQKNENVKLYKLIYTGEDSGPCTSALALTAIPSNKDGTCNYNSFLNGEGSNDLCPKDQPKGSSHIDDTDSFPEYKMCYASIAQYARICESRGSPSSSLRIRVRKHLISLGWRIEALDGRPRYKKRNSLHYTSPNGSVYYSLSSVCKNLTCSAMATSGFEFDEGEAEGTSGISSASDDVCIEPRYCPQAIVDWCLYGSKRKEELNKNGCLKKQDISLKAKQHLVAAGWVLYSVFRGTRREMCYTSPNGRSYNSLARACNSILHENSVKECCTSPHESGNESRVIRLRRKKVTSKKVVKEAELSDQNVSHKKVKKKKAFACVDSTRVLRSTEKTSLVVRPGLSQRNPRTILSWLIDNNVVLPRAKVYYRGRKACTAMTEGRVTREGIKCNCCHKIFTLSGFEAHSGSTNHRPAANIFLQDGRSLLECQMQAVKNKDMRSSRNEPCEMAASWPEHENDYICSVCRYGGELILCDQCPSSFHKDCIGLMDVPAGDWFCPSCCCRICGQGKLNVNIEDDLEKGFLNCHQCEQKYHLCCLKEKAQVEVETSKKSYWFCTNTCEKIFVGLQKLIGKPVLVGIPNLTWTVLKGEDYVACNNRARNVESFAVNHSKLNVAITVMHECFEPVREPVGRRDIIEDVVFSRSSGLNRLNFKGFYTVMLERDDEVITVATVRVHGKNVAEIPLVGTRFPYRRLGMCRILMNELEKTLTSLGVERLVLPAASSVLNTWTSAFGFSKMNDQERRQFLSYTFLDFQATVMCQKLLKVSSFVDSKDIGYRSSAYRRTRNRDNGNSHIWEVCQTEQTSENDITDIQILESEEQVISKSAICKTDILRGFDLQVQSHFLKCYKRRRISLLC